MSRRTRKAVCMSALALGCLAGAAWGQNNTIVASRNTATANQHARGGYVTPSGRWVVFTSQANNLVSGDLNNRVDVFVRDTWTNTVARVNVPDPSTGNLEANDASEVTLGGQRIISDSGRFVIFTSHANNLVAGDTNNVQDVFVRDRDLDGNGIMDEAGVGKTRTARVSLSSNEGQGVGPCPNDICDHYSERGVISASGRYVAWQSSYGFTSDTTAFQNVYWRDRDADNDGIYDEAGGAPDAAVTRLVSKRIGSQFVGQSGDGFSANPSISGDGRWVAFDSVSRFMVFSDSVANQEVFARDMLTDSQNIRISEPLAGGQPDGNCSLPFISGNGRFVAFVSAADNLASPVNSAVANIIVKDRDTDTDGVLDESGAVVFDNASRTYNAFVLPDGIVMLNQSSTSPSISDDGRYVAFSSASTNHACSLFNGCDDTNDATDVFVFDRTAQRITRASVLAEGGQISGNSRLPAISSNGRFVAFTAAGVFDFEQTLVRALLPLGNATCAAALPASTGQTYSGDTYAGPGQGVSSLTPSVGICDANRGNSAWFRLVAPCTGQLTIDTIGSSFDTVLAVFPDSCNDSAIACHDDINVQQGIFQSSVTITVQQGQAYRIRVAGFGISAGRYLLNVGSCQASCAADFNHDGNVDPDDLSDYIAAYFSTPPGAGTDWNADGNVDPDDLSDYIAVYFGGC